jgi:hypothetical protein
VSNKFVESIIPSVEANPGSPGNAATILLYERAIFGRLGSMTLVSGSRSGNLSRTNWMVDYERPGNSLMF